MAETSQSSDLGSELPSSSSFRARLWMVAPLLLALVAIVQFFLVHGYHLNRGKVGSFGMFSTVDRNPFRLLRLTIPTEQGEFVAQVPNWTKDRLRIVGMPTPGLLNREVRVQGNRNWVLVHAGESESVVVDPQSRSSPDIGFLRAYVYESDDPAADPEYFDSFLVPARKWEGEAKPVVVTGTPTLELYRLVYKGEGRFGAKQFISSNP